MIQRRLWIREVIFMKKMLNKVKHAAAIMIANGAVILMGMCLAIGFGVIGQ